MQTYSDAIQEIMERTGCTWKQAEDRYADMQADFAEQKFEQMRDEEMRDER